MVRLHNGEIACPVVCLNEAARGKTERRQPVRVRQESTKDLTKNTSFATCHHFLLRRTSVAKIADVSSRRVDGRRRSFYTYQSIKGLEGTGLAKKCWLALNVPSDVKVETLIGGVYVPNPSSGISCFC